MTDTSIPSFGKLTFPYGSYPNFPCGGYLDAKTYTEHVVKLLDTINDLSKRISENKENVLLHISIGAAMEEAISETHHGLDCAPETVKSQWIQLFPYHLQNILHNNENNEKKVKIYHLIISPNKSFATLKDEPAFISVTKEMKWKKLSDNCYTDNDNMIEVMIFCTPFPQVSLSNNSKIKDMQDKFPELTYLDELKQSANDIEFVNRFYKDLNVLFGRVEDSGGTVTCFSFAVFNETTRYSSLKNYHLFPSIKALFNQHHATRLLAEWTYFPSCYVMIRYAQDAQMVKISYSDPYCIQIKDVAHIVIQNSNLLLTSSYDTNIERKSSSSSSIDHDQSKDNYTNNLIDLLMIIDEHKENKASICDGMINELKLLPQNDVIKYLLTKQEYKKLIKSRGYTNIAYQIFTRTVKVVPKEVLAIYLGIYRFNQQNVTECQYLEAYLYSKYTDTSIVLQDGSTGKLIVFVNEDSKNVKYVSYINGEYYDIEDNISKLSFSMGEIKDDVIIDSFDKLLKYLSVYDSQ